MSNRTYDICKAISLIWIPLIATIIIGIGEIWGIDILAPIGATLTMVDAALGVALAKASADYIEDEEEGDE